MAIGRKTGGRQAGTVNKRTQDVIDKLDRLKCDPIEGMALIAKKAFEEGNLPLAGQMFKELAQYVAPKRKAVQIDTERTEGVAFNIQLVGPEKE